MSEVISTRYNFKDLTSNVYGRLTITGFSHFKKGRSFWKAKCSCGNLKEIIVAAADAKNGGIKSCGCLNHLGHTRTHGMSKTKIHNTWLGMIQRCYDVNCTNYKNYGGRGIKMCDSWLGDKGFINFYADRGQEYETRIANGERISIDRFPDINGNYTPENTRWSTLNEQARHKRDSSKTINFDEHVRQRELLASFLHAAISKNRDTPLFKYRFGLSLPEFRQYIASLFTDGMTWENHGYGKDKWHFDHILGCNNFDLSKEEDILVCCNYKNLRPMWQVDHTKKSKCLVGF